MLSEKKKRHLFIIAASLFVVLVLFSFAYISAMSISRYDRSNRLFSGEKYFYYDGQLIIRDPGIRDNIYKRE